MADAATPSGLFGDDAAGTIDPGAARTGVLPYQTLKHMLREGELSATHPITADQVQPASLDLRLGRFAYRVRASFLPGPGATVRERVDQLDGYPIDISDGAVLERGCVYVIELLEWLDLKGGLSAFANPKSSTGRLDILTRLITDRGQTFDIIDRGYKGPLYVEVAPRTFSVVVRTGTRLNQVRFRRGSPRLAISELRRLHDAGALVAGPDAPPALADDRVAVSVDLEGSGPGALVGFRAKKHTDRIDLEKVAHYDPAQFWEPIHRHQSPSMVLNPDDFYILATREEVRVPPEFAAEMVAYDTTVGEFRVHYAGFFDPGFGCEPTSGSRAVLEVRSHEVPFMLEHGQTIGFLRYERMAAKPDRLYGTGIGSNYQNQGLRLAKQFRQD